MFFLKKKEERISRTNPGFEEHGERKTPKTGIILLVIMFIAGLYFGWSALGDISSIVNLPPPLSSCAGRYGSYERAKVFGYSLRRNVQVARYNSYDLGYYGANSSRECKFSELEKKHQVPGQIEKRIPLEEELARINKFHAGAQSQLQALKNTRISFERQYGIGLQEKQAGIPKQIYQVTPEVQNQITSLLAQEKTQSAVLERYAAERDAINEKIKSVDEELKVVYKPVFDEYNKKLRWYELKVFLLQFLFVFPLFVLSLFAYFRLLKKNSPYTIIFTPIIGVVGLLLLRVILIWFWGLFLARVLEVLLQWIQFVAFFRTLLFYLGMILSFLIFGGGVYYLQKRIFNPQRVIIRRFRAKQCPHCQANLDLAEVYCPNCGAKIRETCPSCNHLRFIGMPACPHCGNKKE